MTVPGSVWPDPVGAFVCASGPADSAFFASPKSRIFTWPSFDDEKVLGLQVPVDDPLLMRRRKALGHLQRVIHGLLLRDRTGVELPAQRLAFQKLHDGIGRSLVRPEVVDRENIRMRQRRDRQGLALEPRQRVGIRGQRLRQDLDRHVASQLRVPRPIHLSHPARAQRRQDLVGPEPGPR